MKRKFPASDLEEVMMYLWRLPGEQQPFKGVPYELKREAAETCQISTAIYQQEGGEHKGTKSGSALHLVSLVSQVVYTGGSPATSIKQ